MLCSIKLIEGFTIAAQDGELGKVRHAYFDDESWTLRYLIVQTGGWLLGRDVLISPHAVERIEPEQQRLLVRLTRAQLEQAPDVDTDRPVSRQQEARFYDYYGYAYYWGGGAIGGAAAFPMGAMAPAGMAPAEVRGQQEEADASGRGKGDPHLRSTAEVAGYRIEASDGNIGHVEDYLFEPGSWVIRHIVVDTRNWLPGRKVLLEPSDIDQIDWSERHVRVRLSQEAVKSRPEYDPQRMAASGTALV